MRQSWARFPEPVTRLRRRDEGHGMDPRRAAGVHRAAHRWLLPKASGPIGASGQNRFSIGTDRDRLDPVRVLKRLANWLAGSRVPQPGRFVGSSGGDHVPSPAKGDRPNFAAMRQWLAERQAGAASQRRVPTRPPVSSTLPSGLKAAACTSPPCSSTEKSRREAAGAQPPDSCE